MNSSINPSASLLKHFENLEDPRTDYLIEHKLLDIIGITICAVICGAETWVEIKEYGTSKCEWLKKFLELPNGIPSHDTISRLFAQLNPEQLQSCFSSWIQTIAKLTQGEVIAIDGKTVRHSYDQGKKGDYILSLKGNQGSIHRDVQQLFDWAFKTNWENISHEACSTINKGHGRIEIRRYWLLSNVEHLIDAHLWSGLKRVGLIESERRVTGQPPTIERRYYLLSLDGGVQRFAQASRSHWGIDNQLHWCLDVAFKEDDSRIRLGHAPENMALIRHIALNLLSQETSTKVGKKAKRLKAGWDNNYLAKVLTG